MKIVSRLISVFLIISLVGCSGMPIAGQSSGTQTARSGAPEQAAAPEPVEATPGYWTGDGGAGKSIAILAPSASGLEEDQDYLPGVVQGEFVDTFTRFSAMSVLDRERLQEQYDELLGSGYYDDNAEAGMDLGHLLPTDYLMGGSITRTATGYVLQIQVTRNADKMMEASYSGTCTFDELDNLTGIRRASLDLLEKLGVESTAQTKTELAGAASTNHVDAQAALARAITARRQGTEVEAMSYYFQAAALDSSLLEATNQASIMSANISSGNIGADARNDIEWRRQWVTRLTETEQYFTNLFNANSLPYTLFYSTEIMPGAVNYQTETQTLSIHTNLRPSGAWVWLSSVEQALRAVYDGLDATKRKQEWGFQSWPWTGVTNLRPFQNKAADFTVTAELVNSRDLVIGRANFRTNASWSFNGYGRPEIRVSGDDREQVRFTNVKVDDITDSLTIRITSVNGIEAETAAKNGVLQVKAISKADWNYSAAFTMNRNAITGYDTKDNSITILNIWDEPVLTIGSGAFRYTQLTGVNLGDRVTSIGDSAFENTGLTAVTIGNGVTSIGNRAFANNKLTYLTIGNKVTSIGKEAFENNRLAGLAIPNSVISIGDRAFSKNEINSMSLGNSVASIGAGAFAGAFGRESRTYYNSISNVPLPNSVTFIGDNAFGSLDVSGITIGANVNIADNAFVHFLNARSSYDSSTENSQIIPAGYYSSDFAKFYNSQGRKAGYYSQVIAMSGNTWTYSEEAPPAAAQNKEPGFLGSLLGDSGSRKSTSGVKVILGLLLAASAGYVAYTYLTGGFNDLLSQ